MKKVRLQFISGKIVTVNLPSNMNIDYIMHNNVIKLSDSVRINMRHVEIAEEVDSISNNTKVIYDPFAKVILA